MPPRYVFVCCALAVALSPLRAEEPIKLSASQWKSMHITTQAIAETGDSAGSALPARVVVPNAQMRVVAAPVAGMISSLAVAPGSSVRKGQVLANISSPEALALQRDALQASSQSALMQENLRRDEALFKEGLIAESRLQATRAAAAQANAQSSERSQGLAISGIAAGHLGGPLALVAPIDGVVLEQGVQLGQRVEASAPVYRIARLSPLWLEAQLPLTLAAGVREGLPVRVAGTELEGKVLAVGRAVDPASQSVLLRAVVAQGAERLNPGQMVEVLLSGTTGGGHRIPAGALVRHNGQPLVFTVVERNEQEARLAAVPVRILAEGGGSVTVAGLKRGDSIVSGGASGLKAILAGIGKE